MKLWCTCYNSVSCILPLCDESVDWCLHATNNAESCMSWDSVVHVQLMTLLLCTCMFLWHSGVLVKILIRRSRFCSRPFHFHVMTMGKLFTHVPLSPNSVKDGDALQLGNNRRSGITLAMHHRLNGIPNCWLSWCLSFRGVWHLYLTPLCDGLDVFTYKVKLSAALEKFLSFAFSETTSVSCQSQWKLKPCDLSEGLSH